MYLKHELKKNIDDWEQFFGTAFDEMANSISEDATLEEAEVFYLELKNFMRGNNQHISPVHNMDCLETPFSSIREPDIETGEHRKITYLWKEIKKVRVLLFHSFHDSDEIVSQRIEGDITITEQRQKEIKEVIRHMKNDLMPIRKQAFKEAREELEKNYHHYRQAVDNASTNGTRFDEEWQKLKQQLKSSKK